MSSKSPNTVPTLHTKGLEHTELQCEEKATAIVGKKALILSLIRHGEAVNQVTNKSWSLDADLTAKGEKQVEALGKEWKDVRIDHLYSSTLKRAYRTALAISRHNKGRPQVIREQMFVEREIGQESLEYARAGNESEAARSLFGPSRGDRFYQPPGGGESFNMVATRAHASLIELLKRHGKDMEAPPDLPGLWRPRPDDKDHDRREKPAISAISSETLVDGIPHVVLASHNVFLTNMYEDMYNWGTEWSLTECGYDNAAWSRHVVWLDIEANNLKFLDLKEATETCCIQ